MESTGAYEHMKSEAKIKFENMENDVSKARIQKQQLCFDIENLKSEIVAMLNHSIENMPSGRILLGQME